MTSATYGFKLMSLFISLMYKAFRETVDGGDAAGHNSLQVPVLARVRESRHPPVCKQTTRNF